MTSVWILTVNADDGIGTSAYATEELATAALREYATDHFGNQVEGVSDDDLQQFVANRVPFNLDEHDVESGTIVHTDEGATYTPWTDGWAVGFHVTAPGKPDRWLLLNPSTPDSLDESNAFVYLESHEPTTLAPPDQPVCYVTIWD